MPEIDFHDRVIEGDCLKILPQLPTGIVHAAFLDTPYNFGVDYGDGAQADRLSPATYLRWVSEVIRESVRRLTERGSIWVLSPERWADEIGVMLKDLLPRRNRIIWRETFGQYGESRFPNGHRHLFWHVQDLQHSPFHTDEIRVPSQRMKSGDKRSKGPRVPDDVWAIPRLVGNAAERLPEHPCQLPEELLRRVILASTQRSNLVLDPTAGTGTTLRVAQQLNRHYLGIEKQPKFVDVIRARLRESYQTTLFEQ